jgi:hypothetical protein
MNNTLHVARLMVMRCTIVPSQSTAYYVRGSVKSVRNRAVTKDI